MPLDTVKINKKKVGFFRFRQKDGNYLLTNDTGQYCRLSTPQFERFLAGEFSSLEPGLRIELENKNFINEAVDFYGVAQRYTLKNSFLRQGTSLHIVVVTLRCDHKCIYCQTSARAGSASSFDMSADTARQVVDRIFESPSRDITIEFQGGEPLLNFPIVRFIVDYAREKNKKEKRNLFISLVSNLVSMDDEKCRYLTGKGVSICTSIDGPPSVHNKNRVYPGRKDTYGKTVQWFRKLKAQFLSGQYRHRPNALLTITRHSLKYPRQIVDEYVRLGCEVIHLRPANPFGVAKAAWKKISYTPGEFFRFYKTALDYIVQLNLRKKKICERTAAIFLKKILTGTDPNYLDIRSPCGAGIGQLAYDYNGDIYTCDEGRMLARMGDESFKIGDVAATSYDDIINSNIVKTTCIASCLENIPHCADCVYNPYCGVCPVYNYSESGNLFGKEPFNARCQTHMMILDYLFLKLQDKEYKKIFDAWSTQKPQ